MISAGRQAEIAAFTSLIDEPGRGGMLLHGPIGVGKTHLARVFAELGQSRGFPVEWISATATAKPIPLGCFASWLSGPDNTLANQINQVVGQIVGQVVDRVSNEQGQPRPILVIDDAQFLDEASAVAVHQIGVSGRCTLILVTRDPQQLPGSITTLWKDEHLARCQLKPLDRADALQMMERMTAQDSANLDQKIAEEIWERSGGIPLFIRELTLAAEDAIGGDPLPVTERLRDIVASYIVVDPGDSPAANRDRSHHQEVLELLAQLEEISMAALMTVADEHALVDLGRSGLIEIQSSGDDSLASISQPLVADVLRSSIGPIESARIGRQANELLQSSASGVSGHDRARAASVGANNGITLTPADVLTAAEHAQAANDFGLAYSLLTLLGTKHSFEHERALAVSSHRLDDPVTAEEHLANAMALADDNQLVDLVIYQAQHRAHVLGQSGAVAAVDVQATLADLPLSDERRLAIDLLLVELMGWGGNFAETATSATAVLSRIDPTNPSYYRIAALATYATSQAGPFTDLDKMFDAVASQRHEAVSDDVVPELWEIFAKANQAMCGGPLLSAATIFDEQTSRWANRDDHDDLTGIWQVGAAQVLAYNGERGLALQLATEGATRTRRTDPLDMHAFGAIISSCCAYALGEPAQGTALFDEFTSLRSGRDATHARTFADTAKIWHRYYDRGPADIDNYAATLISETLQIEGSRTWCLFGLIQALRMGAANAISDAITESSRAGSPLHNAACQHQHALQNDDPDLMITAAQAYQHLGWSLLAGELNHRAAHKLDSVGRSQLARRCELERDVLLHDRFTPFVDTGELVLSTRQRQIAELVAAGKRNREIADQLFLSVRTVENHLAKTYRLVEVEDRAELTDLMSTLSRPSPAFAWTSPL